MSHSAMESIHRGQEWGLFKYTVYVVEFYTVNVFFHCVSLVLGVNDFFYCGKLGD